MRRDKSEIANMAYFSFILRYERKASRGEGVSGSACDSYLQVHVQGNPPVETQCSSLLQRWISQKPWFEEKRSSSRSRPWDTNTDNRSPMQTIEKIVHSPDSALSGQRDRVRYECSCSISLKVLLWQVSVSTILRVFVIATCISDQCRSFTSW